MIRIHTSGPRETQQVGRIIGEQARPGDIYLLTGPLGAGKTCLTQGIAWGLGVAEHARSPTFVLMTRYRGRLTLYHLDLYRIGGPAEAWDLGVEEHLSGDGVCVVEWAERAEDVFPEDALWIALDYAISGRAQDEERKSPQPPFSPPLPRGDSREGKGEQGGISGEPVEPRGVEAPRTITFGRHSSRYDALLEKLVRALPAAEVCS
jgi:tRNA threonylcarbamoyladenosine biosynthesis protein TsaE